MLSGASIRRLVTGRIATVIGGALLTALAVFWIWKPWRQPAVAGRIILAQPIKGYEAPPRWAVTLPDAPDVAKRLEPGPTVEVPTLVPKSSKDQRALERQTGLNLDAERIVARKDVPRTPGGATVTAHVPAEGGPVELTIVARPESWRAWDPGWEVGLVVAKELGLDSEWGPLGWALWSPGRVWRIYPVVGGMLGEHVCSRGCVIAGGVVRFD